MRVPVCFGLVFHIHWELTQAVELKVHPVSFKGHCTAVKLKITTNGCVVWWMNGHLLNDEHRRHIWRDSLKLSCDFLSCYVHECGKIGWLGWEVIISLEIVCGKAQQNASGAEDFSVDEDCRVKPSESNTTISPRQLSRFISQFDYIVKDSVCFLNSLLCFQTTSQLPEMLGCSKPVPDQSQKMMSYCQPIRLFLVVHDRLQVVIPKSKSFIHNDRISQTQNLVRQFVGMSCQRYTKDRKSPIPNHQ